MVTWSALGLIFLAVIGLACIAGGALEFMAGAMSDAPQAGDRAGKVGYSMIELGVVLIVAAIVGMVV